jgi:invasion protein IalB
MRALAFLAVLCLCFAVLPSSAQEGQPEEPLIGAEEAAPPASWATRCVSAARAEPADCSISQRAVTQQGQLVGAVTIRVPREGGDLQMIVTGPLGIYIPAGIAFNIDGGTTQPLQLRTCDRNGCVADVVVNAELLAAMRNGQKLNVVFRDGPQRVVTLPMSLIGFTAAINKAL